MSKKFQREESILERLEQENRQLKAINRSLTKRLKSVSRGYRKFQDEENQDEKENIIKEAAKELQKMCWTCRVGKLNKVELGNRYYRKCDSCPYRTKTKATK